MTEVSFGFERQVMIQEIVVFRIKFEGRSHLVERPEVEPLGAERMDHAPALPVLQHPVDLLLKRLSGEFVRFGEAEELLVRNRKPKDPGKISRHRIGSVFVLSRSHQKTMGTKNRLQPGLGRRNKIILFLECIEARLIIGSQFLVGQA